MLRPDAADARRHRYDLALSANRVRYATLTSAGLLLAGETSVHREVTGHIAHVSGARTYFRAGKPVCRSLDGVKSIRGRSCADCPDRLACTPQMRLVVEADSSRDHLHSLLLSHTSAHNLVTFIEGLSVDPVGTRVVLRVQGRRSRTGRPWGELTFSRPMEGGGA